MMHVKNMVLSSKVSVHKSKRVNLRFAREFKSPRLGVNLSATYVMPRDTYSTDMYTIRHTSRVWC